jgi:hypothetical protein
MRSGKKRHFSISESEESEQQESEQQTSSPRPTRSRNAPQRFTSSSYPTTRRVRSGMPRKPRKARHTAAVTRSASRKEKKLEGEMERCEEEEEFVSSYAYDHIGQAIREEFPTVWVDVPVVDLTRVSTNSREKVLYSCFELIIFSPFCLLRNPLLYHLPKTVL